MKILATGDLHGTNKKPKRRTDDYFETFKGKFTFILDTAQKEHAQCILQPGDFFDSWKASDYLKQWFISKCNEYGIPIITVYGQHDLRFHSSDKENTPLAVLEAAGVVHIAGYTKIDFPSCNTHMYGCSWGEEVPTPSNPEAFNILLIHKMIIKDKKLWYGQEDFTMARAMLKGSLWDLVISGDNHQSFTQVLGDKTLINCGSLMRSTIAQKDHKPCCYIFDTETGHYIKHLIPHRPFNEVFDETKIEEEKERNEILEAFVDSLQNDIEFTGLDFTKNLQEYLQKTEDLQEGTIKMIEEMIGGFEDGGHIKRARRTR